MKTIPHKFIGFFDLIEAMKHPGCPVCGRVAELSRRSMESFLYESVNDAGLRAAIRHDRGLCHRHTWQLVQSGDSLGGAIVFRDILNSLTATLDCSQPGWLSPKSGADATNHSSCIFCRFEQRDVAGVLHTLAMHVDDPEVHAGWAAGAVLCIPHLHQICAFIQDRSLRHRLLQLHRHRYESLSDEMAKLIQTHSYEHRSEGAGNARDSWVRAAALIVGRADAK